MPLSEHEFSEKRDFIRMRVNHPAEVSCGHNSWSARCTDLSGSGLSLRLDQDLPMGTEVTVVITTSSQNPELGRFAATATVRRKEALEDGDFHYGLSTNQILE